MPKKSFAPLPPDYGKEIRQAQKITTHQLFGLSYPRVRFGKEAIDCEKGMGYCGDCAVKVGMYHVPGCHLERCPHCQEPLIHCHIGQQQKMRGGRPHKHQKN